jgi:hypothetical protein
MAQVAVVDIGAVTVRLLEDALPRCTIGWTVSAIRWIAPRSAVSSPTSPSTTSTLGRRPRIGMRFFHETACGAH